MKKVNEYEQKLNDKVLALKTLGDGKESEKYQIKDGHISLTAAAFLLGIKLNTLRQYLSFGTLELPKIKIRVSAFKHSTRIMLVDVIKLIESRK